jgi:transcriptional regulator with XRE-family HTH domain
MIKRKGLIMENIIRQVLTAKKMTQAQLAGRIGIKREYLNKIINRHITPTVSLAIKIGQSLDVPVEELFSPMDVNKKHDSMVEKQDKIIGFMLQEGLDITDLYNAVYLNEQRFMNRLLEKTRARDKDKEISDKT